MISQAGQFVILDDGEKFIFSKQNKVDKEVCIPIIEFINENYDKYKSVGTAGIEVNSSHSQNEERIVSLYKNEKNVQYIATIDKDEKVIIFKTEDLSNYFDITGFLRRKRSGSSNISKTNEQVVKDEMINFLEEYGIHKDKVTFERDGNYFVMTIDSNVNLEGKKIEADDFIIFVSKKHKSGNVLTRLSNTNNPNVIFTLEYKESNPGTQENDLITKLR